MMHSTNIDVTTISAAQLRTVPDHHASKVPLMTLLTPVHTSSLSAFAIINV